MLEEEPISELPLRPQRQRVMAPRTCRVGAIAVAWAVAACGATSPPAEMTTSPATAKPASSSTQPHSTAGYTTPAAAETPSRPLGQNAATSCVDDYDLTTLVDRAFAFDGTVTTIGENTSPADDPDLYIDLTFDVHEWFAGDGPRSVTVEMFSPGVRTSVETADYEIGSRLLISGEPRWGGTPLESPVVWMCGFSRTYDSSTAANWRQAFNPAE